MSLVTIIVPVKNGERFVQQFLNKLEDQTFKDFQVYLVDNCSTDNTKQIISENQKRNKLKINYLYCGEGKQGAARNLGLKHTKSDLISFMDIDDFVSDNFLNDMVGVHLSGSYDYVVCNLQTVTPSGKILSKYPQWYFEHQDPSRSPVWLFRNVTPCNKLYRREFITKHNLTFPENIQHEDFIFTNLVTSVGIPVGFAPGSVYYYVKHDSSHVSSNLNNMLHEFNRAFLIAKNKWQDNSTLLLLNQSAILKYLMFAVMNDVKLDTRIQALKHLSKIEVDTGIWILNPKEAFIYYISKKYPTLMGIALHLKNHSKWR